MCQDLSEPTRMVDSTPATTMTATALRHRHEAEGECFDPTTENGNGVGVGKPLPLPRGLSQDQLNSIGSTLVPANDLDRSFRVATACAAMAWAGTCAAVFALSPSDAFQYQSEDGASLALGAASLVMGASVITRGLALFFREPDLSLAAAASSSSSGECREGGGSSSAVRSLKNVAAATSAAAGEQQPPPARTVVGSQISGAALAGFFVQACSSITNGTMALFPTPTFVDPVTRMDVCLLRWCEWAPLAFLMAFLTAGMDADRKSGGIRPALNFGLCQGISTLCGLLFPLLNPGPIWWTTMAISVLLHSTLHPLLAAKTRAANALESKMIKSVQSEKSPSPSEVERAKRVRVAAQLIQLLTVAWTALVVMYFVAWYLQVSSSTHAVMECSVEVLSKHLYLNFLLDAHHLVFDATRREEWTMGTMDESSCESSDDEFDSDDEEDEDEIAELRRKMD